jgi:hypothetical protein
MMPSTSLENSGPLVPELPSPSGEETPNGTFEDVEAPALTEPLSPGEMLMPDEHNRASTDIEGLSYEYEYEDARLATEKHGRARSLDSTRVSPRNDIQLVSTLTEDQRRVVEAATDQLTSKQQERIAIRQERVATHEENNIPETSESRNKGKAIDPRNWGDVEITPEEMDVSIQEAMYEAYKLGLSKAKKDKGTHKGRNKGSRDDTGNKEYFQAPPVPRHESIAPVQSALFETRRAGSKPATQIVPGSSLGVALENIARMANGPDDPDGPPDPSGDDYSSD